MRTQILSLSFALASTGLFAQNCDSVDTQYAYTYLNHGAMFNVVAHAPITLDHLTANLNWGTAPFSIYYRNGKFQGYENSPGAWTLIATASVTSNNTQTTYNAPTLIPITLNLPMSTDDTIALYFTSSPVSKVCLTTTTIPWGTMQYSDANLSVSVARSIYQSFGTPFSTPQVWNGTVAYCSNQGTGVIGLTEAQANVHVVGSDLWVNVPEGISQSALRIQLTDLSGRAVLNTTVGTGRSVVPTTGLTGGVYVALLLSEHGVVLSQKVLLP